MVDFVTILSGLNQGLNFVEKLGNVPKALSVLKAIKNNPDYIILNMSKEVTVYGNGHGIITFTCDFYIINPSNFINYYRKLKIEDSCDTTEFPLLSDMMKCSKKDRFKDFGFWYSCTGDCIAGVEEYYWSDNDYNRIDHASKANKKELRWKFIMNTSQMQRGGVYTLTYAISIPGMFPITNYKFNCAKAALKTNEMSSSLKIEHYIRSICYTVSFEKGITFSQPPTGKLYIRSENPKNKSKNLDSKIIPNVFYNKYRFISNKHKNTSCIKIDWTMD